MPMRRFLRRRLFRIPSASESIPHIDDFRFLATRVFLFDSLRAFGHEATRCFLYAAGDVR